jgi:serine/threonine protein phosphatase PrpC
MWLLDGHHGAAAAKFGAPALAKELGPAIKGDQLPSHERISQSFRAVDNQLRKELKAHPDEGKAGSTVVGLLASKQNDGNYTAKLINCGDSRGVVFRGPTTEQAPNDSLHKRKSQGRRPSKEKTKDKAEVIIESIDHKPNEPKEKARIEAAGGRIRGKGKSDTARIDGHLAVSRGLGDFRYKSDRKLGVDEQKVTCSPDIYEMSDLEPGTLVVLACDGLWDVMSTEDVTSLVSSRVNDESNHDLADIARDLVNTSLKKKSGDNVTVLLAQFGESPQKEKKDPGSLEQPEDLQL